MVQWILITLNKYGKDLELHSYWTYSPADKAVRAYKNNFLNRSTQVTVKNEDLETYDGLICAWIPGDDGLKNLVKWYVDNGLPVHSRVFL